MPLPPLPTGQTGCYDVRGQPVECAQAVQDTSGQRWTSVAPRFAVDGATVADGLTGLVWSRSANAIGFGVTWPEALAQVAVWNREAFGGQSDWRLPNRRELRSLLWHAASRPALPPDHPFHDIFLAWVWTSTSAAMAPTHAWRVHLEGGRMFYGRKDDLALVWPVRGQSQVLPRTGQEACFGMGGLVVDCPGSGQDGDHRQGVPWPSPRFEPRTMAGVEVVADRLTGLAWLARADLCGLVDWSAALEAVVHLAQRTGLPWRLPDINALESLVDASRHSPALPQGHPFIAAGEAYWSSTSSGYDLAWAFCLYLHKGAVGVGHKPGPEFLVWPMLDSGVSFLG